MSPIMHLERPHVLIMGDYRISPWIDADDLQKSGGIIVWCAAHCLDKNYAVAIPPYLTEAFPNAEVQQPLTLLRQTQANRSIGRHLVGPWFPLPGKFR